MMVKMLRRSLIGSRCLPLLCSALLAACATDETALKVHLVGDQQLNTTEQILAVVQTLELILDAPTGFSGVSGAGDVSPELTAADKDADGVLELVIRRTVRGRSALPLLRLLPGSNLGRSFKLGAQGLAGEQIAALGGLAAVSFDGGQSLDLLVPFNLRAAFRAPRVLVTLPRDGQADVPSTLNQIFVEFSKEIAPDTLEGNLQVVYEGGGAAQPVPGKWVAGSSQVVDVGLAETRSTATFYVGCRLSPGAYRVLAGAGVTDAAGVGLDQDAGNPGPDELSARFMIPGTPDALPCAEQRPFECARPEDCDPEKTGKFTCLIDELGGTCVPAVNDCGSLDCAPGYVCVAAPVAAPPPLPCQPRCDEKCIDDLKQQGLPQDEIDVKCCEPCAPDPACTPACDQVCVEDMKQQGIFDPQVIKDKCCTQCPDRPQPEPAFQCVQDCRVVGYCPLAADGLPAFCDEKQGLCVPCSDQPSHPACGDLRYADCREKCAVLCSQNKDACAACYNDLGCEPPL